MEKDKNNIKLSSSTFQKVSSQINPENNLKQYPLVQVNQPDEQGPQKISQDNKQNNGLSIQQQQMSQQQSKSPKSSNNNLEDEANLNNINRMQNDQDENIYNENAQTTSPIRNQNEGVKDMQKNNIDQQQGNFEQESQIVKKQKEENEKVFLELDQIYYEIKTQQIDEVELQTPLQIFSNLNENQLFNPSIIIPFLNQNYQDQFNCISKKGNDYMNLQCTKIIKIYKYDNQEQEYFRIPIVKVLQSLEGGNDELVRYFKVISTIKYTSQKLNNDQDKQTISFYATEIDIGQNTLHNVLNLLNDTSINQFQMQSIFSGLIDILLQIHSRYEVANEIQFYQIYMHQNNLYLLDFFENSKIFQQENLDYIPEGDLLIYKNDKVDYFKKDIQNLGKCLLGLEMIKTGYSFQSVLDLLQIKQNGSEDNLILFAKKHNCNQYFLKTKKFIAIEEGQIILYEVQNILEEMLQQDPKKILSSVKLSMLCQKTHLLMRDINYQYMNQFPPSIKQDQEINNQILYFPFKPIKQVQDQDNNIILTKNDQLIFKGQLDAQKKPTGICQVQIFQEYNYEGFFVQGFPYLNGKLKFKNNIITEGDCYNFIFKQWLYKSKILDEVIILQFQFLLSSLFKQLHLKIKCVDSKFWIFLIKFSNLMFYVCFSIYQFNIFINRNLFQISKWIKGSIKSIELDNIIIAGGNKKIIKLNNSYMIDSKIFISIQSIVGKIEMISLNNIDAEVIEKNLDLEKLKEVKYLIISLDSDEKVKFLIKYLNCEFSQNLEVLDLSNSTKLDYRDYELNKILNSQTLSFTKLKTLVLKNCKSTSPYQFISTFVNNQNFQKILNFYIDETFVDQNLFGMISDSSFTNNLRTFSLEDTSGINDFSVTQLSEKLTKFKVFYCYLNLK